MRQTPDMKTRNGIMKKALGLLLPVIQLEDMLLIIRAAGSWPLREVYFSALLA